MDKSPTVAEIKSLLIARYNAQQSRAAEVRARIQRDLGCQIPEVTPTANEIQDKFINWLSGVLARRLKRNRRTTPLISSRDCVHFVALMNDEVTKAGGDELEAEERAMLEKFVKTSFDNLSEMAHAMVPTRKNPYEEYWRWIKTVFRLANERGVTPTDLLASTDGADEIARRTLTKKQFIAISKKGIKNFTDADSLKKMLFQTLLAMLPEDDEEGRCKLIQELEAQLMPQLREMVAKAKPVISALLNEEVERIYTTP